MQEPIDQENCTGHPKLSLKIKSGI